MVLYPIKEKNENIMFIIPPLTELYPNSVDDADEVDIIHPPLGVLYLSAYVKAKGYKSFICDGLIKKIELNEIESIINKNQINIVGITSMSANYKKALELAAFVKNMGCIVIIGGAHASSAYKKVVSSPYIDVAIIGEGEVPLMSLLNAINQEQSINNIQGIAFKEGDEIVFTGQTPRIRDLDSLPLPDYEGIDMKPYIALQSLGLISSRGCPNNCLFCSSKNIWGRQAIFRSANSVIQELDYFNKIFKYKGKELIFYDDNLTLKKDRLFEICDLMIKKDYQYRWKCMSRIDTITSDMLIKMKQAGCYSISFGIESANNETLSRINKNITTNDIEKAIKMCNDAEIKFHGYFMIGFPWETSDNFMETINFIRSHPEIESSLSILSPYPGTDFYDNSEKWDIEIEEVWDKFNHILSVIKSENYSSSDIYTAFSTYLLYEERKHNNETQK